jgi:hypothetical protein
MNDLQKRVGQDWAKDRDLSPYRAKVIMEGPLTMPTEKM